MSDTTTATEPKTMPVIDTKIVDARLSPFLVRAKACTVTTVEEDAAAKKEFVSGKEIERFIVELYSKPKKTLHQAHKDMVDQEKKILEPLQEALGILSQKCIAFKQEQERKAAEEQKRLADLAAKEAEELKINEAIEAEKAGDQKLATAILSEPVETPVIRVAPSLAKVSGAGTQKRYKAEVTSLAALVKYVASKCDEDPGVLCYLEAAMPALNREAVTKKDLLKIPGVRAVGEEGLTGRSAAPRFAKVD